MHTVSISPSDLCIDVYRKFELIHNYVGGRLPQSFIWHISSATVRSSSLFVSPIGPSTSFYSLFIIVTPNARAAHHRIRHRHHYPPTQHQCLFKRYRFICTFISIKSDVNVIRTDYMTTHATIGIRAIKHKPPFILQIHSLPSSKPIRSRFDSSEIPSHSKHSNATPAEQPFKQQTER